MAEALDGAVMGATRCLYTGLAATALAAAALMLPPVASAAGATTAPVVLNLRQRADVLRHDSERRRGTVLPRLLLFDSRGRLVMASLGDPNDVAHRLTQALKKDQPLNARATLVMAVSEAEDHDGKPVDVDALPKADAYVVDYWADWCSPCHILARDLERFLPNWDGVRVVWLKIEADPTKLKK